jgi:hypothetical protein
MASRTTLGHTQPPIQWVLGALSLGVRRPGHEVDHSSPSSAMVKECMELYLHSPNMPSWCGTQGTGITLPLPLVSTTVYLVVYTHTNLWIIHLFVFSVTAINQDNQNQTADCTS